MRDRNEVVRYMDNVVRDAAIRHGTTTRHTATTMHIATTKHAFPIRQCAMIMRAATTRHNKH